MQWTGTEAETQAIPQEERETKMEEEREQRGTTPAADLDCPLCQGLGATIRKTPAGRIHEWPCAYECRGPITFVSINHRRMR